MALFVQEHATRKVKLSARRIEFNGPIDIIKHRGQVLMMEFFDTVSVEIARGLLKPMAAKRKMATENTVSLLQMDRCRSCRESA
jgi:hypothetical protein